MRRFECSECHHRPWETSETFRAHTKWTERLYPLRQGHLSPAINAVHAVLSAAGLQPAVGPMSTLVTGEADSVFSALHEAFLRAATHGHVVMTLTLSNPCPVSGGGSRAMGVL